MASRLLEEALDRLRSDLVPLAACPVCKEKVMGARERLVPKAGRRVRELISEMVEREVRCLRRRRREGLRA